MSITPGTPVRITAPSASQNPNDPDDTPILPENTVGVTAGPYNPGDQKWLRLIVSYEAAVRPEDIEAIPDHDEDGDGDQ